MKSHGILILNWTPVAAVLFCCAGIAAAQETGTPANPAAAKDAQQGAPASSSTLRLTLQDALALARKNSTQFQGAQTDSALAHEDKTQARDALLPSVNYNNTALYTQSNGPGNGVRYIANNAVHEYISQGNVHEALDVAGVANFRRASYAAAVARARADIASRGLVVTVVQSYYAVAAAQQKLEAALKTANEGEGFYKLTQELERGGEVAHSDVIKSELQMQERQRQLQEARLGLLNSRLDLTVLIFPDFSDNYEVADDLHAPAPLPTLAEIQQQAAKDNPEVRAALATVHEAGAEVTASKAG
jgi:outer membrane protein TolC